MNKISIKSFLFENGLISEVSADWKKDFLLGSKGMTKSSEDTINYAENIYFTGFGGEENVRVINKTMANWLIKQITSLGGPANVGTIDRDKMITIFSWLKISGSEGNMPKMDLNAAFEYANGKIEDKKKKENADKGQEEDKTNEPPLGPAEEKGLAKRVKTLPDGRYWVKVDQSKAGEFFDMQCQKQKYYGVGCQSFKGGHGQAGASHRAPDRISYTLLGPLKGEKNLVSSLLAISVSRNSGDIFETRQAENKSIGSESFYGWDDLDNAFVEFLGTPEARKDIKSINAYGGQNFWEELFRKNKFDLLNKLDTLRPDLIEASKQTILQKGGKKATEWFETRNLDAIDALAKFGPEKFIQNIDGYTKSVTFQEALNQLKPLLPALAEKNPNLILSKIDFLLGLLPADDFKKIIAKVGLTSYIENNISDFEKMLKKLKDDKLTNSKVYKEIFNSIVDNYFQTIIKAYKVKGPAGVDKFMDFLEMPKSDKHKFLRRDSEGIPIALKKEVLKDENGEFILDQNQQRQIVEKEFPLTDSHTIASKQERRSLLKKNESFIKSLIDGSDEKKDIDFLKIYFLETSQQERTKELKAEKEKVINYYNNQNHLSAADFINDIPMPGIFKFYQILNKGVGHGSGTEESKGVNPRHIPTYKFDLDDLRNTKIVKEIVLYFRTLITGSPDGVLTPEVRYEILHHLLLMLKMSGENKEEIIKTIKKYDPANLPAYKNTSLPISFVAYKDYFNLFNVAGFEDSEILKYIKENSEEIIKKMTYGDYEKLVNYFSISHYNVNVGDMVEFLGEDTTGYNDQDKLVKKKMSLAYLFMGRRYKIAAVDENAKDRTGNKSAKIKVLDNRGSETEWMNTSDFAVKTKYINESNGVRKYINKKLFESYKKIKK